MPGAWKCWLNICYLHHYPSWCMYLDWSWLSNLTLLKKGTRTASCLFYFSFPSPPFIKLCFLCLLFSDVPTKCHPHFIWILHHYYVLNDRLPQSLAPERKRDLTREVILVVCQNCNHREETGSHQSHQKSTPGKQVTMTWFHEGTRMGVGMGLTCLVSLRLPSSKQPDLSGGSCLTH